MNKSELEKLSDFELSSLILNNGVKCFPTTSSESQACFEFNIDKGVYSDTEYFDINNWSDMGQIIESIWSELMDSEAGVYTPKWEEIMEEYNCGKLRAAAIVYLLKLEGE